ncbi:MAG TPA: hypothetical protein VEJ84_01245 [Acidimicrobiales bacterium]|nr:hypothetical protein [Acidimicrobiales bacterium]
MVVPQSVRYLGAVLGAFLVLTSARSVIVTVIVPRPTTNWLTRGADRLVNQGFRAVARHTADYRRRDRVLSAQAATVLIWQLVVWLVLFYVGYSLLLWPLVHAGITTAFVTAGSALWAVGEAAEHGAPERAILDIAALTSLITVALQIAYLPTLYSAFNHRETEVALLNARAGLPGWGPELLARTHYGLGSGQSTIDTLPQLYTDWERWAADVTESHTTYPTLVRFRSPEPLSSWLTALLTVLDSAALYLSLSPSRAPTVSARLCLRGGFLCLRGIARTMGLAVTDNPADAQIILTYQEFVDAVKHMQKVGFPIERDPEQAWPDFVGWRVNYEQAAYAIGNAIDAPPALWSGPRRFPGGPIAPIRPPL